MWCCHRPCTVGPICCYVHSLVEDLCCRWDTVPAYVCVCAVTTVLLCVVMRIADRQTVSGILMQFSGYQRSRCLSVCLSVCVLLTAMTRLNLHLWLNPKIHWRVHKRSQLIPVHTEINSAPPSPQSFPKVLSSILSIYPSHIISEILHCLAMIAVS